MPIRAVLHLVEPTLAALGLDTLDGLQLYHAASIVPLHHPPLNPDTGALILSAEMPDAAKLKQVLLNQYPADHPLALVDAAAPGEPARTGVKHLTLAELDRAVTAGQWALYVPPLPEASSFERFQETIAHLRAPEGCPWDRKQTHASLRPYLLEEAYEVLDALDVGDMDALREELGDLLLQIVLHSQVAVDNGTFRMADIIAAINHKIVHRHPHVWGNVQVNDEQDVKVNWDRLKKAEKNHARASRLDGVPKSLPALSQAYTYQDRAARVHFDWDTIEPVIAKLHEEIEELLAADENNARAGEAGDVLFAVVNLARWLGVDPESALRAANARFYRRFHHIEQEAAAQGRDVEDMSLAEMDALWDEAKAAGL
ncbi:MAG: nucleoside triphosphate pyrophosphohydrolase [Anaerolineae bacterium]|nr:nucleoside triphosphate pyrophosphohydrolase [Anaerolineae bacterium]